MCKGIFTETTTPCCFAVSAIHSHELSVCVGRVVLLNSFHMHFKAVHFNGRASNLSVEPLKLLYAFANSLLNDALFNFQLQIIQRIDGRLMGIAIYNQFLIL